MTELFAFSLRCGRSFCGLDLILALNFVYCPVDMNVPFLFHPTFFCSFFLFSSSPRCMPVRCDYLIAS